MQVFNIIKFYTDFNIQYFTKGEKVTQGWINISCCFCNSHSPNLGFHLATGALSCWRCGTHSHIDLIQELLNVTVSEAFDIHELYSEQGNRIKTPLQSNHEPVKTISKCRLPEGSKPLTKRFKDYLIGRNFDPEELEELWGLKCVEAVGDYKWRLIGGIYYEGKIVSYQGRDITGKSDLKWKTCAAKFESIQHKEILHGLDYCKDKCLVVEGMGDLWRMGKGAVCTFGIAFTLSQVNLLASKFKQVFIMYDGGELNAIKQAEKLAAMLSARGVSVEVLYLDSGDPGDLSQKEANRIMKDIGLL